MVRVWDTETGALLETFNGHADSVYSVSFSSDGMSVVSGALDQTLKVWDLSQSTLSYLSSQHPDDEVYNSTVNNMPRHTFAGIKLYKEKCLFT